MKRLRSRIGGSQQLFIPILPKPAPTAVPANTGVASVSSKNAVTSVAMPTNNQLSGNLGTDSSHSRMLLSNLPALDLSLSSIIVAQTESTPPVQNSGNMASQGPTKSLNESSLPVSSSWNLIAQGPSPASTMVKRTELRPLVYSSVNMVLQSQLPVPSTIASQTTPRPSVHSSGNIVAQSPLLSTTIDSQTASRPAVHSLVNMVTQNRLPAPSSSVSQTASTPQLQSSANMLQQSQLPMLATVSQTLSSQPLHSSVNMVPQGQLPSSSDTAFRPPVNGSFNMVTRNQLPMSTSFMTQNISTTQFQNSGNMVGQGQLQEFVSGTVNQPILGTPSQIASFNSEPLTVLEVEQSLRAILEGRGAPPIGDTNGNLDSNGSRNMLQATETGSQMINEIMDGLRDPDLVSSSNATPPPNTSASDMWAQSPGLTTLANAIELVQREQHIDSIANNSNVQVLHIRCLYTVFNIWFWCHLEKDKLFRDPICSLY